jgi:hypothetical protein
MNFLALRQSLLIFRDFNLGIGSERVVLIKTPPELSIWN